MAESRKETPIQQARKKTPSWLSDETEVNTPAPNLPPGLVNRTGSASSKISAPPGWLDESDAHQAARQQRTASHFPPSYSEPTVQRQSTSNNSGAKGSESKSSFFSAVKRVTTIVNNPFAVGEFVDVAEYHGKPINYADYSLAKPLPGPKDDDNISDLLTPGQKKSKLIVAAQRERPHITPPTAAPTIQMNRGSTPTEEPRPEKLDSPSSFSSSSSANVRVGSKAGSAPHIDEERPARLHEGNSITDTPEVLALRQQLTLFHSQQCKCRPIHSCEDSNSREKDLLLLQSQLLDCQQDATKQLKISSERQLEVWELEKKFKRSNEHLVEREKELGQILAQRDQLLEKVKSLETSLFKVASEDKETVMRNAAFSDLSSKFSSLVTEHEALKRDKIKATADWKQKRIELEDKIATLTDKANDTSDQDKLKQKLKQLEQKIAGNKKDAEQCEKEKAKLESDKMQSDDNWGKLLKAAKLAKADEKKKLLLTEEKLKTLQDAFAAERELLEKDRVAAIHQLGLLNDKWKQLAVVHEEQVEQNRSLRASLDQSRKDEGVSKTFESELQSLSTICAQQKSRINELEAFVEKATLDVSGAKQQSAQESATAKAHLMQVDENRLLMVSLKDEVFGLRERTETLNKIIAAKDNEMKISKLQEAARVETMLNALNIKHEKELEQEMEKAMEIAFEETQKSKAELQSRIGQLEKELSASREQIPANLKKLSTARASVFANENPAKAREEVDFALAKIHSQGIDLGELGHFVQQLIDDYETKQKHLSSELNELLSVNEAERLQWEMKFEEVARRSGMQVESAHREVIALTQQHKLASDQSLTLTEKVKILQKELQHANALISQMKATQS